MKPVLSCDIQDHFEHACVLRLPVRLTLRSGEQVSGFAWDITKPGGVESLVLKQPDATIALADIKTLRYPHEHGEEVEDGQRWRVVCW